MRGAGGFCLHGVQSLPPYYYLIIMTDSPINICAALRSDLARQAQDLAAIRADCRAAAEDVGTGIAAMKEYVASLAGNGQVGAWIGWRLSGLGAVQAESACMEFMLWALHPLHQSRQ